MEIMYLDELERCLKEYKLQTEDVIIVGSAVLTHWGIRKNNDLEIIVRPEVYKKLMTSYPYMNKYWAMFPLSDHVDLFHNMYSLIGVDDITIWNLELYEQVGNFKICYYSLEKSYKKKLVWLKRREKDHKDVNLMSSVAPNETNNYKLNYFVNFYATVCYFAMRVNDKFLKKLSNEFKGK